MDALLEQLSTAHNWKVSYFRNFVPRAFPLVRAMRLLYSTLISSPGFVPLPPPPPHALEWKKGRRKACGREMCRCKLRVEILRNFTFGASVSVFIVAQCIKKGTLKTGSFRITVIKSRLHPKKSKNNFPKGSCRNCKRLRCRLSNAGKLSAGNCAHPVCREQ